MVDVTGKRSQASTKTAHFKLAVQKEYFYYDSAMGQFCNSVRIEIVKKSAHPYFEFHKHFFKFSSSTISFGMYLRTMVHVQYMSYSTVQYCTCTTSL